MIILMKSILTPIFLILALLIFGLALLKYSRKKWVVKIGWLSALLGIVFVFVFSIQPVANLLVYSLESRYSVPSSRILYALDVVVILGAGIHPEPSGCTYGRLYSGVNIFKQSGAHLLVLCGDCSSTDSESGGNIMKTMAMKIGIMESKILTETSSGNTMENAIECARLLSPGKKRQIGLVTCSQHMLRATRAFNKQFPNDTIVPIPVNRKYMPPSYHLSAILPSAKNLDKSTSALHEWIGLIWYSIRYR